MENLKITAENKHKTLDFIRGHKIGLQTLFTGRIEQYLVFTSK